MPRAQVTAALSHHCGCHTRVLPSVGTTHDSFPVCAATPYFFLLPLATGACRCANAYNSSGVWGPVRSDGTCEQPLVPGYAWSRCDLGASFAITQRKKGWWQAEVRLNRWKSGSTIALREDRPLQHLAAREIERP